MRRFSQRNSLVTLSEINVTPLLDLAFVLLIIFIIISPSIRAPQEHGMELNLPQGGAPDRPLNRDDLRTVEISSQGEFLLEGRLIELDALERTLLEAYRLNPRLMVSIRADETGLNKDTYAVIDICRRTGMGIDLRTRGSN
jgi:biopolymer transport protein ExbD